MFQKKALISALVVGAAIVGFSATASAAMPGFYAGGDLGWSNLTNSDNPFKGQDGANGLGAGAQFGYQFNDYIAAEAGYTYFHNANGNWSDGFSSASATYKEQAASLDIKGIIPLNNCFNIYGKAGAAYVNARREVSGNFAGLFNFDASDTSNVIRPTYGIGVGYSITPNLETDLSFTRIQRLSNGSVPNADITALGLTYFFG